MFFICIDRMVFKSKDIHILLTSNVPEEIHANLAWDNTLNLEQTYNACGPYATMAYAFVKAGVKWTLKKNQSSNWWQAW